MRASPSFHWLGIVFYLTTIAGVLAQATTSSQASSSATTQQVSQNQALLQAYQEEQKVLIQEKRSLVASGATQEQLAAWRQQNDAQFAAQLQRAQAMATISALQPMATNRRANIPANASPALRDFLTSKTALGNARAQIHNQFVQQAAGSSLTYAQLGNIEQQESELFQQQNAALLTLQAQRSLTLTNESTQTAQPVPPPVVIAPNTTPQMAAFLTVRNQLMRERVQLWNQYVNAAPSVREAVLQQWRQQNAGRIQQLQQLAQNLAQASSTTHN